MTGFSTGGEWWFRQGSLAWNDEADLMSSLWKELGRCSSSVFSESLQAAVRAFLSTWGDLTAESASMLTSIADHLDASGSLYDATDDDVAQQLGTRWGQVR